MRAPDGPPGALSPLSRHGAREGREYSGEATASGGAGALVSRPPEASAPPPVPVHEGHFSGVVPLDNISMRFHGVSPDWFDPYGRDARCGLWSAGLTLVVDPVTGRTTHTGFKREGELRETEAASP